MMRIGRRRRWMDVGGYPAAVGEMRVPSVMRKPPGVDLWT